MQPIVNTIDECGTGEASKHDRVRCAYACAREHCNSQLGNQRHVKGHAIAAFDVGVLENVSEFADLSVQLLIGVRTSVARFTFPNQCSLVSTPRRKMSIETVVRDIDLATTEPFRVWRFPLKNRIPFLEPMKLLFSESGPEGFRVVAGLLAQLLEFLHRLDVCSL